ncbi:hypothetical protein [Nocardia blacklockiae]|uniref:hypothetical protein n=1 Tax=Nocardia blacklockiae TaxID=480036 RepID=UPI0018959E9F|nr:hypothetical protein [Nocardia blacklockiae]MBF6174826.1 hypothetical protein [Nocardia blacklockiae]
MTHDQGGGDRSDQSSDSGSASGDAPDAAQSVPGRRAEGTVDAGWLRPHARRALGRPRVSTVLLIVLWIAVLLLYLQLHP